MLSLLYGLGKAHLFEPDEGRNAEIAREILVTQDWVTPHDNFLPALDKPIAFFWLVAIAYKLFGITEASARLISALAAAGCLFLVYRFGRALFGPRQSLWSIVVLVTSAEFFLLARIVIFDMTLTFFICLALIAFYRASHTDDARWRRRCCFIMYAAMGAGSLIKGPIALLLPLMVICPYLLLRGQLRLVARLHVFAGSMIFLVIVLPWYIWAELRNPGYLKYFLWEEHFLRFFTAHFGRTEPWYYFIPILAAGFFPWTLTLPVLVNDLRRKKLDDATTFLILWTVLPFLFFSLSRAKLPHYILPMFPPLAILTASCLERGLSRPNSKWHLALSSAWLLEFSSLLYSALGGLWPILLPQSIRPIMTQVRALLWIFICAAAVAVYLTSRLVRQIHQLEFDLASLRVLLISVTLVPVVIVHIMATVSRTRSAKALAETAFRVARSTDQMVFYDTYQGGLLFYLQLDRPVWLVWSGTKSNIMGSWYVAEKHPPSTQGKVLFTFAEFAETWLSFNRRLLVCVKDSRFNRLPSWLGAAPKELARADNFVLATNR